MAVTRDDVERYLLHKLHFEPSGGTKHQKYTRRYNEGKVNTFPHKP